MDPKYQAMLRRAESTFGSHDIKTVIGETRAIIGVKTLPAGETDAQSALDKLRKGQEPPPKELAALEVMMHLMRPAPLVSSGKLDPLPPYNKYERGFADARNRFREIVQP